MPTEANPTCFVSVISDVRAGLLAMLSVRDPVGTNQFVPGGHGSAFDRVGAFQEGFLKVRLAAPSCSTIRSI